MSARKRRSCELDSSSDEEPKQEEAQKSPRRRHSERIETRRKRPTFRLPSREKVWDSISSETSPLKHYSTRKTVSDFTKVYNTYNFDDWEDTSDDDVENFFAESSENSDDEKKSTGTRLKNYHRRIRVESSSSDEGLEIKGANCKPETQKKGQTPQAEDGISVDGASEVKTTGKGSSKGEEHEESEVVWSHDCNEHDNGDSDEMTPSKRRRNVSVLVSDDDDDDNSAAATNATACEESNSIKNPPAETVTVGHQVGSSSDSDSESDSDSSGDDGESRASRLRRKSLKVFQQFKEAQAKRKMSLESKST